MSRTPLLALVAMLGFTTGSATLPVPAARAQQRPPAAPSAPTPRELEIVIDSNAPAPEVVAQAGAPIRLRFIRRDDTGCTREVVFPWLGLRRTLPVNEPVVVELPPQPAGRYEIRCGMNMLRAILLVRGT